MLQRSAKYFWKSEENIHLFYLIYCWICCSLRSADTWRFFVKLFFAVNCEKNSSALPCAERVHPLLWHGETLMILDLTLGLMVYSSCLINRVICPLHVSPFLQCRCLLKGFWDVLPLATLQKAGVEVWAVSTDFGFWYLRLVLEICSTDFNFAYFEYFKYFSGAKHVVQRFVLSCVDQDVSSLGYMSTDFGHEGKLASRSDC